MNTIEEKLVEMEDRIMNFQKESGFNTIFDLLNEDIEGIRQEVKLILPVVVRQSEQLFCSCGGRKVKTTGGSQCTNNRCNL